MWEISAVCTNAYALAVPYTVNKCVCMSVRMCACGCECVHVYVCVCSLLLGNPNFKYPYLLPRVV